MFAGQKMLHEQFPKLQGFQDTLFSQVIQNFTCITGAGMLSRYIATIAYIVHLNYPSIMSLHDELIFVAF